MHPRPVALVTGGARRLGRDIALELAAHGWDVALHYRHSADEAQATARDLRTHGAVAEAFAADLADEAECRALVPAVLRQFGRLDAVVNNASLFEHDDVLSFGHALMEQALAQQRRPGRPAGTGAARTARARRHKGLRDQPARPETVEPEPGLPVLHAVQGGARSREHAAGAGAGAARARVRRGARRHLAFGSDGSTTSSNRRADKRRCSAPPPPKTSPVRCASCSNRPPSPAPRCSSMGASTCRTRRAT